MDATDKLIHVLTFVSALSCGLVGGIFFAFSTFVMSKERVAHFPLQADAS